MQGETTRAPRTCALTALATFLQVGSSPPPDDVRVRELRADIGITPPVTTKTNVLKRKMRGFQIKAECEARHEHTHCSATPALAHASWLATSTNYLLLCVTWLCLHGWQQGRVAPVERGVESAVLVPLIRAPLSSQPPNLPGVTTLPCAGESEDIVVRFLDSRVYGNSSMHMDNSNNAAKLEADGYMCVCLRPSICIVTNVHVCTTNMLFWGALCVRVTCKNGRTRTHTTQTRNSFLFRKLLHCGPPFLLLLLACSPPLFIFGLFPIRLLVREERLNRG